MSDPGFNQLRVLAFGGVDGALWAAAVDGALVVGEGAGATSSVASLGPGAWSIDGDGWRLAGDGVELTVEPASASASAPAAGEVAGAAGVSGVQELCRVRGSVRVGDRERAVDCAGARLLVDLAGGGGGGRGDGRADGGGDGRYESVRAVCGWVADDEGFALAALRPRRHRGHESDVVAATLFDPQAWVTVADPRLSTTYDADGVPARVNLELWIGDGETEFPRRVAGEAVAPGVVVDARGDRSAQARIVPLRCHSHGHEGFGAYILASL